MYHLSNITAKVLVSLRLARRKDSSSHTATIVRTTTWAFANSEMEDGHDTHMRLPKGYLAMSGLVVELAKSLLA